MLAALIVLAWVKLGVGCEARLARVATPVQLKQALSHGVDHVIIEDHIEVASSLFDSDSEVETGLEVSTTLSITVRSPTLDCACTCSTSVMAFQTNLASVERSGMSKCGQCAQERAFTRIQAGVSACCMLLCTDAVFTLAHLRSHRRRKLVTNLTIRSLAGHMRSAVHIACKALCRTAFCSGQAMALAVPCTVQTEYAGRLLDRRAICCRVSTSPAASQAGSMRADTRSAARRTLHTSWRTVSQRRSAHG